MNKEDMPPKTTVSKKISTPHYKFPHIIGLDDMLRFVLVAVLILVMVIVQIPAVANDGVGEVGLGGVVTYGKTTEVSMQKEVLEIGTNLIKITYEFLNESDKPVTLPVLFPLPAYSGELPSSVYGGQPANFNLLVDDVAKKFEVSIRAICHACGQRPVDTDVTEELKEIGLSSAQIAILPGAFDRHGKKISMFDDARVSARKVSTLQMQQLRAAGLLQYDPNDGLSGGEPDFPAWEVHVTYIWNITFPPGKIVSVKHSYSPFLGLGSSGDIYHWDIERGTLASVCASSSLVERLAKAMPEDAPIPGAKVNYILTTANTWKGPIKNFTLRLKKSSPGEFVSLCFPGKFVRIDSLTLESHLSDFAPSSDLMIQFLDPNRSVKYGELGLSYGMAPRLSGEIVK